MMLNISSLAASSETPGSRTLMLSRMASVVALMDASRRWGQQLGRELVHEVHRPGVLAVFVVAQLNEADDVVEDRLSIALVHDDGDTGRRRRILGEGASAQRLEHKVRAHARQIGN